MSKAKKAQVLLSVLAVVLFGMAHALRADLFRARDPGVRGGEPGAGGPLAGLTGDELRFFTAGLEDFSEAEGVADGLGPRFNLDSCVGCHIQPSAGGSSPSVNPQVAVATAFGAKNAVPSFIRLGGPVREARFKRKPDGTPDGGVHALFVISGRVDTTGNASTCTARQEDFDAQAANNNVIFRIPTPTFGLGLVESIPDSAIVANINASSFTKKNLGISGRPNRTGNDGTITRFGWKAQNKSLMIFAGEAYNVEMGITNEMFQQERDENPACQFTTVPNDVTAVSAPDGMNTISAVDKFAHFMRFLAPPTPAAAPGSDTSRANGQSVFASVGCALCHTPKLRTTSTTIAALSNKDVNLYSDLALHGMGPGLADEVSQGDARGNEFRTAPLWGVGQRIFLLHDGRTTDLGDAIQAHRSSGNSKFGPSEANAVIDRFNNLREGDKQDLYNFLRSL
jgi:CxxC motif-containing protein (DUF1111 family)